MRQHIVKIKTEHVHSTDKKQVPIGIEEYSVFFSGAIVIFTCCLIALAVYYAKELDNVVVFWLVTTVFGIPIALFGFSRIKKMSKDI